MRAVDQRLRAVIERLIDDDARGADDRSWPLRHFRDPGVLFLTGDEALFWFLGLDGRVYAADHDTFAMRLEVVTDPAEIDEALRAGVRRHPELAELLGGDEQS